MEENEISRQVIGAAIEVHRNFGPGLLESVYEEALCHELNLIELPFVRQQAVPIQYKGIVLTTPLRLDLLVHEKVIIECKAKTNVLPIDKQQLLTYLRLKDKQLGLLINFNVPILTSGVHRVVNQL